MTEATLAPLTIITALVVILGAACALSCKFVKKEDRPQVVGRFVSAGVILALAAIGGPALSLILFEIRTLLDRGG